MFERKLAQMPFELSNPVWVDDDDIDLDYHIRRVMLSKPGTFKQLEQMVGRLHSSLLDRSRPLWEFYVIEGLETGQPAHLRQGASCRRRRPGRRGAGQGASTT